MKESKKRENLNLKRQKPFSKLTSLETWDQTDLEDADEKALEKRLHQLKLQLQLAQDEPQSRPSHHSSSKQKKKYNPDDVTSESDVSESVSSMSNVSSGSVHKYKSKKSSSYSDNERSRPRSSRSAFKKQSKQTGQSKTHINDDRLDTRMLARRKVSPLIGKRSSRVRSKKSPSLDKRDLYNRLDTDRWHDKAKEFEKERNVKSRNEMERDRSRGRSRTDRDRDRNHDRDRDRGRHTNDQREMTRPLRNDRTTTSTKRSAALIRSLGVRRKEPLEPAAYKTRTATTAALAAVIATTSTTTTTMTKTTGGASIVSYDNGSRRGTVMSRKLSPKDERLGRQDDRRADCKVIRRNDNRSGDLREPILRGRDCRDRKDRPLSILADKSRDYREPLDHNQRSDHRERGVKINDDRLKEREVKRLTVHDRLGPRTDGRDAVDTNTSKFRRLSSELTARITSGKEVASGSVLQRYQMATTSSSSSSSESVFDRMRNRYNDRKNTVGVTACERNSLPETSGMNRLPIERRRNFGTLVLGTRRSRSPLININRDYKDAEKSSCVAPDRRILSPANSKKSRDTDGRGAGGAGGGGEGSTNCRNTEDTNIRSVWAEEKNKTSQVRSRSHSCERRKRRRSSQEEWRVIDMTSPVDDQMAVNETNRLCDTALKLKRSIASKYTSQNNETFTDAEGKKKNRLTDELSDISDEDFNEVNATDSSRNKKDGKQKNDAVMTIQSDSVDQRLIIDSNTSTNTFESEKCSKCSSPINEPNTFPNNETEVIFGEQKKVDEDANTSIGILSVAAVTTTTTTTTCEKVSTENIDSEEETDSFTVSRVSDALGVDWADFVEESKRKRTEAANYEQEMTGDVKRRWNTTIILTKVGISAKYVGEDVFEEVRRDAEARYAAKGEKEQLNKQCSYDGHKLLHVVPALHSCLNNRMAEKTSFFEPYKTAISARKDIVLRRKLCGLPVKNSHSQHLIGICHWIV